MSQEYRIETVADFGKIPADRLDVFLEEFRGILQTQAEIQSMLALVGVPVEAVFQTITWIDDGEKNKTLNLGGIKIDLSA